MPLRDASELSGWSQEGCQLKMCDAQDGAAQPGPRILSRSQYLRGVQPDAILKTKSSAPLTVMRADDLGEATRANQSRMATVP
jgi:hypothetical protein